MSAEIRVDLGVRSYPIHIAAGLLERTGEMSKSVLLSNRALLVADETVDRIYGGRVADNLSAAGLSVARATVPSGESSKSTEQLSALYSKAVESGLDRKSAVIALGGGVVGDLAGFLAASFLRGIRLIQIPTTLLAMVDSAVGGKTGINLKEGKNLVGAFHQPSLVLCDPEVLKTLPPRELAAGLAEVIKYGVIKDAVLFEYLEKNLDAIKAGDPVAMEYLIARSCGIKAEVVSADEFESGERAILNFGHTLAHAIEKVAGYGAYLHGEAVGIGMVYAARLSVREKGLSPDAAGRIEKLVRSAGLPAHAPELDWSKLRAAVDVDKKNTAGLPRFVLAEQIGHVVFGCPVAEQVMEEVWYAGRK